MVSLHGHLHFQIAKTWNAATIVRAPPVAAAVSHLATKSQSELGIEWQCSFHH